MPHAPDATNRRTLAAGMVLALAACGGRSSLLETLPSEGLGASSAGGRAMGGKGGSESTGGISSAGDTSSAGGKSGSAGTLNSAGAGGGQAGTGGGQGGRPGMCSLAMEDCATPKEPACQDRRAPCVGSIASYELFESNGYSLVNDVAASPDGRVAVTGYHFGETYFGSHYYTTDASPDGRRQRAYVASFDTDPKVDWVYQDAVPDQSQGVSLAFAKNGDILLQARHIPSSTTGAGLLRLNPLGQELWRRDWGTSNVVPVAVAVGNDGRIWSSGNVYGPLGYPGSSLDAPTSQQGYLLQTDDDGTLLQELTVTPPTYQTTNVIDLQLDDAGSVIVIGTGTTIDLRSSGFLRKFSASGEPLAQKDFNEALMLSSVVVDRSLRVTIVGSFKSTFVNEGSRFQAAPEDLFIAQYSSDGELLWQKTYSGQLQATAATVDAIGNLIVAGFGSRLVFGAQTLVPEHDTKTAAFVLKLRPNGSEVWAQKIDGGATLRGAATDTSGHIWVVGKLEGRAWLGQDLLSNPDSYGLLVRLNP